MDTRRSISLKEYGVSCDFLERPYNEVLEKSDKTLINKKYRIRTDKNGFIISNDINDKSKYKIFCLGDSFVENKYVDEDKRLCSQLETYLYKKTDIPICIKNCGMSGSNTLNLYNLFINKIIPQKPLCVLFFTTLMDISIACLDEGYWNFYKNHSNLYLQKDLPKKWNKEANFDNYEKILELFIKSSNIFKINFCIVTACYRNKYDDFSKKIFKSSQHFQESIAYRKELNTITKNCALKNNIDNNLFDIEPDINENFNKLFYDNSHLNEFGSHFLALKLIDLGLDKKINLFMNNYSNLF